MRSRIEFIIEVESTSSWASHSEKRRYARTSYGIEEDIGQGGGGVMITTIKIRRKKSLRPTSTVI